MQTGGLAFQNGTLSFRYSGNYGVQTDESGLLYMRSRYYSPNLRQFLSADSYMGDLYHPASLNPYSYVKGSPFGINDSADKPNSRIYMELTEKSISGSYNHLWKS